MFECYIHNIKIDANDRISIDKHLCETGHTTEIYTRLRNGKFRKKIIQDSYTNPNGRIFELNPNKWNKTKCVLCSKQFGKKDFVYIPMRFTHDWQLFKVHKQCEINHHKKYGGYRKLN